MSRRRNPTLPASLHPALRAADGAPYFSDEALEEANREGDAYKSRTALVLMDPADFLRMADPGKEEARQVALERVLREGTRLSDVPRLFVDYDKTSGVAVVTGHEGRHRSRSLLARGVKQMPVRIHSTNIRWSEQTSPRAWDYIEALPHTLTGEAGHAYNRMPMPVPIHYPELAERMMKKNPRRTNPASKKDDLVFYHGTLDQFVPSILRDGLKPAAGWGGANTFGVFLSGSYGGAQSWGRYAAASNLDLDGDGEIDFDGDAERYARAFPTLPHVQVLKVTVPAAMVKNLRADMEQAEEHGFEGAPKDWRASLSIIGDVMYAGAIPSEWLSPAGDPPASAPLTPAQEGRVREALYGLRYSEDASDAVRQAGARVREQLSARAPVSPNAVSALLSWYRAETKRNPAARAARTTRTARAPKTYLFSYGSNSPRQLAERLGHAVKGRAAFVEGHLRAFRGWSNRWEGGVATLIPGRGKTFGYIAEVTPDDLAILDRYEGVATGNYRRANMQVTTNDGEKVQAIAYLASSTEKNAPSRAYKRAVAETIGAFWEGENGPVTEADITVRNPRNPLTNPAKWFGHLVTDDQKVTISKEPIAEVQNTEALQKAAPKPRGLWYACGSEWIEWLEGEMPHWLEEGQNLYDVRPRYSTVGVAEGYRGKRYVGGVLRITTDKEMEMFDLGFHVTDMQIDWPRVASIWDGIEICPYQYSFRDIYGWYYGWDVASGCIWRPSGADGLTLLHSRVARSTPPRKPRGFGSSRQRHTSMHGPRNNPRRMDGSVRPTRATQVNAYLAENGFPGVMLHRSARDAYCHFYGGDADYWDDTSVYVPRISDLTLDAWLAEARRLAQTKRNPRRRNPARPARPARPKKFSNEPLTAQEKKDSGIATVYLMDWVCDGWGPLPPRIAEFEARRTPLTNAEKRELIDWYESNRHLNMF